MRVLTSVLLCGCLELPTGDLADAGPADVALPRDGGPDATVLDATLLDAAARPDAALLDAALLDATLLDAAARPDAALLDAAPLDAAPLDADARPDATLDAALADAAAPDAAALDAAPAIAAPIGACQRAPVPEPVIAEGAPLPNAYHAACPAESGPVPPELGGGRLVRLLPDHAARDVNCDGYTDLLLLDAGDNDCRGLKLVPGGPRGPAPDRSACLFPRFPDTPDPDVFRAFAAADLAGQPDGLLDLVVVAAPLAGEGGWRFLGMAGFYSDFGGFFEGTKRGPGTRVDEVFQTPDAPVFLDLDRTAHGPLSVLGSGDRVGYYQDDGLAQSWERDPIEVREVTDVLGAHIMPGLGGQAWLLGQNQGLLVRPTGDGFVETPIPWTPSGPIVRGALDGEDGLIQAHGNRYHLVRAGMNQLLARSSAPIPDAGDFELIATGDLDGAGAHDVALIDTDAALPRIHVELDVTCRPPDQLITARRATLDLPDAVRPIGAAIGRFGGPTPELLVFTTGGSLHRYVMVEGALVPVR